MATGSSNGDFVSSDPAVASVTMDPAPSKLPGTGFGFLRQLFYGGLGLLFCGGLMLLAVRRRHT